MGKIILFSKNYLLQFFIGIISLIAFQCTPKTSSLKQGNWRASIERPDGEQIIFNFITKDSVGKSFIYIINADEQMLVDSIIINNDSVIIQLPFYESGFRANITPEGNLQGFWVKNYGDRVQLLPFIANFNEKERFKVAAEPKYNISGRWSAVFKNNEDNISTLIGEFQQNGSRLTGTFLVPSGDYRFLEGVVDGDSLKLSEFDGANAYLFTAKIENGNTISAGKFYSGKAGIQDWSALRNAEITLTNTDENIKAGTEKLNFSFPEVSSGQKFSMADKSFEDKVVIIQLLGSWCPNCMDESKYLSEYYKNNQKRGIEIIGIAYERTTNFEASQKALSPFIKRLNITYPVLVSPVAVSDSLRAEKTLPQIKKIEAFPTTLFVDKKGNLRKITKGFNGPATGEHYIEFQKEFEATVNELLSEN